MPQLLPTQRTDAWTQARRQYLGCSELGAALGLSPHKTRLRLWQEKVGLRPAFAGNVATAHGQENEPGAVGAYEVETGAVVEPGGFWSHPSITWLCGSPDGFIGHDLVLEVKCPYTGTIPDEIPPHYRAQCLGYLEITQRPAAHLFFWTHTGTRLFLIERDRAQWADWYPVLDRFYGCIQSLTPPPK